MVELLIGFVCFCGFSLLNAPWSTVPLLLPLFGKHIPDLVQENGGFGCMGIKREKSGKSSSQIVPRI
jgi:hypothetical protein